MTDLPPPPVPADADLRSYPRMPLDVVLLRGSTLLATATAEEFRAALLLWTAAWHQVPAGSLPADDATLAMLAHCDRRTWCKVRGVALRKWVLASDGRLYHPVMVEHVLDVLPSREHQRARGRVSGEVRAEAAEKRNAEIRELHAAGFSGREIAQRLGCGAATVSRALNSAQFHEQGTFHGTFQSVPRNVPMERVERNLEHCAESVPGTEERRGEEKELTLLSGTPSKPPPPPPPSQPAPTERMDLQRRILDRFRDALRQRDPMAAGKVPDLWQLRGNRAAGDALDKLCDAGATPELVAEVTDHLCRRAQAKGNALPGSIQYLAASWDAARAEMGRDAAPAPKPTPESQIRLWTARASTARTMSSGSRFDKPKLTDIQHGPCPLEVARSVPRELWPHLRVDGGLAALEALCDPQGGDSHNHRNGE